MSLTSYLINAMDYIKMMITDRASIPPANFFRKIKDKRQVITAEMVEELKGCLVAQAQQFIDNGQFRSAKRLMFHIECAGREQKVIEAGINTYVYRDDLDDFITNVSQQVVKIIELENFERKIPDDKSKEIQRVKDLFDQVYIVFTDYTGKEERKIEKRRRANDPIAFGTFKTKDNHIWNHRFYFICDWEDEYCDLTLDKFVVKMIEAGYRNASYWADNITIEELKERYEFARKNAKEGNNVSDIKVGSSFYNLIESFDSTEENDEQ